MGQTGVLLINLGTPDNTQVASVRRYLREFLLDSRVIDLPCVLRWLLVYCVILPCRPQRSAKAYQKIWTEAGSPLRIHSQALANAVGKHLGSAYRVVSAMRYGNPSIANAINQLQRCRHVIVLPLFPQYSSAATGSAIAKTLHLYVKQQNIPQLTIIDEFYQDQQFIEAYAKLIAPHLTDPTSFLLLSYHGLPERHVIKSGCASQCDRKQACPNITIDNAKCYRAQCYSTSKLLVNALQLPASRYLTAFQSRLGRTPWIKPYTDQQLVQLREQGIEHLIVTCPSFVADCLETLEEIGIQAREQWQALGGKQFTLIPCLNASPAWVEAVARRVIMARG